MSENENILFKSRFRFSDDVDLHLLREVYGQNPYEEPTRWTTIQVNMLQITGKNINIRTLKDKVQNLIKKYLVKVKINNGKSGIEVEVTELDDLLQQIVEMIKEFNKIGVQSRNSQLKNCMGSGKSSYQKGYDEREKALASMVEPNGDNNIETSFPFEINVLEGETEIQSISSEPLQIEENVEGILKKRSENTTNRKPFGQINVATPRRKRSAASLKQTTVQYLIKKHDKNFELRSKELLIEERKLLLDERKHELECYERKKKD